MRLAAKMRGVCNCIAGLLPAGIRVTGWVPRKFIIISFSAPQESLSSRPRAHNTDRLFLLTGCEKSPARRSWKAMAPSSARGGLRRWQGLDLARAESSFPQGDGGSGAPRQLWPAPRPGGWRWVRPARVGGHTAPVALHRRSAEVRPERSHEGTTSGVQARPWCFGEGPTGCWPDEHGCGQCPVGGLHGGRYGW